MKELKAKPKVTQAMTRDGLTLENKATGEVENISSREAEQDYTPEAGGTAEKLLERANETRGQKVCKAGSGHRCRGGRRPAPAILTAPTDRGRTGRPGLAAQYPQSR